MTPKLYNEKKWNVICYIMPCEWCLQYIIFFNICLTFIVFPSLGQQVYPSGCINPPPSTCEGNFFYTVSSTIPACNNGDGTTSLGEAKVVLYGGSNTSGMQYIWNNTGSWSAIPTKNIPSGGAPGSQYVTAKNNAGCCWTTYFDPPPLVNLNVSLTSQYTSYCQYMSVNLTATEHNHPGTVLGTQTMFHWSGATSGVTNTGTKSANIGTTTTPVNKTYTVQTKNGPCYSSPESVTVTLYPNPSPSLSANGVSYPNELNICAGDAVNLQAGGGTSYTWAKILIDSDPTTQITVNGTSSSLTVYPTVNTEYRVRAWANGCMSGQHNVQVNVTEKPNIALTGNWLTSPITVCAGEAVTLRASGGSNYTWSGGGLSGGGSQKTVYPTGTMTYSVSSGTGACSDSKSFTVNVKPSPTVSISPSSVTICTGGSVELTASGANTYSWNNSLG